MNFKFLKNIPPVTIWSIIIGLLSSLVGKPLYDLLSLANAYLLPHISKSLMLDILKISIPIVGGLVTWIYILRNKIKELKKLTYKFGIYLNHKNQPISVCCETPMIPIRAGDTNSTDLFLRGGEMLCLKCKHILTLHELKIEPLSLEEIAKFRETNIGDTFVFYDNVAPFSYLDTKQE